MAEAHVAATAASVSCERSSASIKNADESAASLLSKIRAIANNKSGGNIVAAMFEYRLGRALHHRVPSYVRAIEFSQVDSALLVKSSKFDRAALQRMSPRERIMAMMDDPNAGIIPIEDKSLRVNACIARHGINVPYGEFGLMNAITHDQVDHAEVFLVQYSRTPTMVAVIPRFGLQAVASQAIRSDWSDMYGVPEIDLFQVEWDKLHLAMESIRLAAIEDEDYVNPSNGVKFTGWRPKIHNLSSMNCRAPAHKSSRQNTLQLIEMIQRHAPPGKLVAIEFCPVAPLLGDLIIHIKVHGEAIAILVEIKDRDDKEYYKHRADEVADRSPFHYSRVCHQVWIRSPNHVYVIGRHQSEELWQTADRFVLSRYKKFALPDDIGALLDHIHDNALQMQQAVLNASIWRPQPGDVISSVDEDDEFGADSVLEKMLRVVDDGEDGDEADHAEPTEMEVDEIDLTAGIEDIWSVVARQNKGRLPYDQNRAVIDPKWHLPKSATLDYIRLILNRQACDAGSLVFLRLDPGHPFGNLVAVKHEWSKADVKAFRFNNQSLPIQLASTGVRDLPAIILRLAPWCQTNTIQVCTTRKIDWLRLFDNHHPFINLGSLVNVEYGRTWTDDSGLMVLPSTLTKLHDPDILRSYRNTTGKMYIRHEMRFQRRPSLSDEVQSTQSVSFSKGQKTRKMTLGNELLKPGVDPLAHTLSLRGRSVFVFFNELMHTTDEKMRVPNSCLVVENPAWDVELYRSTVGDVFDKQFLYGVHRRSDQ